MVLPPSEIAFQLSEVRSVLERRLSVNLRAIHLFGSAVDGGLKPHSDIDLMISVATPLAESTQHKLMLDLLTHSAPPGNSLVLRALEVTVVALSELVPWRYPPRREMQFGEWLRDDICAGRFESPSDDHDLAILIAKLRGHSLCLLGPEASDLFESVPPADLRRSLLDTIAQWNSDSDWEGDERNIVLALARVWFTACTGEITSKDAAASWAVERLPVEHGAVMAIAAASYLSGEDAKLVLIPERVAATIWRCKAEIERQLLG